MLQKITGKNRRLEAIEVRTPEELKRCDALIIPGGGLSPFLLSLCGPTTTRQYTSLLSPCESVSRARVCADLGPIHRVDHHRAARASERVDGTALRVRQDKAGVGDLCGCDSPRAGRVQSKERRTGTARRRLGQYYEEWLGITGAVCSVTRTEMIDLTACSVFFYRPNLLRPHSRSAGSETLTDPSLEFSSAHR